MEILNQVPDPQFVLGVVEATQVTVCPTPEGLRRKIEDLIVKRIETEFPTAEIKEGIRDLLRKGGYKPSGRGKPASEYLAQAARENRFPFINNLVDINNLISLQTGLPISLLDSDKVGSQLTLRYGNSGESYIFNSSGQSIDLTGLLSACGGANGETPLGNAVKDSMAGKIQDTTQNVVYVLYGAQQIVDSTRMKSITGELEHLLREFSSPATVQSRVVPG